MRISPTAVCLALFSLALLPSTIMAQDHHRTPPTITIAGEGSVRAVPDQASIMLSIVTEAPDAGAALETNSTRMRDLIAAVKSAGIADADLATASVSLEPRLTFPADGQGTPKITGYSARNSLTVIVRDLAKLGPLLDAASAKGSNDIGALTFEHSDRDALTDKARADAVVDAKRRAAVVAEAAGVRLGRVLSIEEGGEPGFAPRPRNMAFAQAKASVPIEAGSREISARVTISWEIAE